VSRLAALLVVLALVPATAAAQDSPGGADAFLVERDNVEIAPAPQVTIHTVEIDNRLGDITVIGRDGPGISLSVVKRAPDEETLERLKVNLVPDPAGIVRISSALLVGKETRPIAAGTVRVDIQIHAPRAAATRARAWNGKLGVTGMHNGAELMAHDGDIVVTNVRGTVATTSMRGRQQLTGVTGSVRADDTYGDLALDEIRGESLAARVHRGTVTATRIRTQTVAITTTFGDIHFRGELLAGGHYELRSYRGNVHARTTGAFRVDAYSRDGVVEPVLELGSATRDGGRLVGSWGASEAPAVLLLSSAAGRVVFGLASER
jgi:hypothetical protein